MSTHETTPNLSLVVDGICPLPHLGVIRVLGEDAIKFVHGQLTQDFVLLSLNEARLAALCSPKGRMMASFIGLKMSPHEILLVCSADILEPTLQRLRMFILRAKAVITDATADYQRWGLAGSAITSPPAPAWSKIDTTSSIQIELPAAHTQRLALWLAPISTPEPSGAHLPAAAWVWAQVMSAVATISASCVEAFVPQMLNYESVGGVSFKKGCYPGQEIVARSQFRGTLKRRAYIVQSEAAMRAGQDIYAADNTNDPTSAQSCGLVVQAAANPHGGHNAIVCLQVSAAEGTLCLDSPQGAALQLLQLPYALLDDL